MIKLWRGHVLAEDVPADEPGEVFLDLEGHEAALGDGKDEIEVFEGAALGFLDEEEDEDEGDDVETGEEAKGASVTETNFIVADGWIEHREKAGKEEVDGDGPGGTGFTVGERETLRGEGERNRTQTGRVSDSEY